MKSVKRLLISSIFLSLEDSTMKRLFQQKSRSNFSNLIQSYVRFCSHVPDFIPGFIHKEHSDVEQPCHTFLRQSDPVSSM